MPKKLLRRLIQKAVGRTTPPKRQAEPEEALRPPGERSGRGASSIEPYLHQTRNSRPGSLE